MSTISPPSDLDRIKTLGYSHVTTKRTASAAALGAGAVSLDTDHYFVGEKLTFIVGSLDALAATTFVIRTPNNDELFTSTTGQALINWCDDVNVIMTDHDPGTTAATEAICHATKHLDPEIQSDASNVFSITGTGNYTEGAITRNLEVAIHGVMIPSRYFTDYRVHYERDSYEKHKRY
jgi:hypothetical protein